MTKHSSAATVPDASLLHEDSSTATSSRASLTHWRTVDSVIGNGEGDSEDSISSAPVVILFVCLYVVVFVIGLFGNSLVVYVVARNRSMQTATNLFIGNLAAADVMMCLLAVPFTPLSGMLRSWPFGEVLCHIVPMTLGVSVYVSTLTSTAIAVNRYFVIIRPFQQRPSTSVCLLLVAAIWVVSIIVSLPLAINQKVKWVPDEKVHSCREHWPSLAASKFFTGSSLILQYLIPGSIITYCYVKVSLALRSRARVAVFQSVAPVAATQVSEVARPSSADQHTAAAENDDDTPTINQNIATVSTRTRRRLELMRRTNRMLIAVVMIFVVCWLPLNVVHVAFETLKSNGGVRKDVVGYDHGNVDENGIYDDVLSVMTTEAYQQTLNQQSGTYLMVFFVVHLIAVSSAVYNPFIYAWMNENFKGHFARVVPCLFGSSTICGCRHGALQNTCCCTPTVRNTTILHRKNGCCGQNPAAGEDTLMGRETTAWSPSKYVTVKPDSSGVKGEVVVSTMAPTGGGRINVVENDDEVDEVDDEEAQLKSFCRRDAERDGIRLLVLTSTSTTASNSTSDKVMEGTERDPLTGYNPV